MPDETRQRGEGLTVRFPPEAVRAIDIARNVGLFKRSRSEFIRDCVSHYVQTHSDIKAEIEKEVGKV